MLIIKNIITTRKTTKHRAHPILIPYQPINHINGTKRAHLPKILPTILLAMFPARPEEPNALPARFEAWLNLSHREKARLLVMVKTRAIASIHNTVSHTPHSRQPPPRQEQDINPPTSGSQMNISLTNANIASATQNSGCT